MADQSLTGLRLDLKKLTDPVRAKNLARFFKTGPGQYGAGDVFLGLMVPQSRLLSRKYQDLSLKDLDQLLRSRIHEERTIALAILVNRFKKSSPADRKNIFDFYLAHTSRINNWDLVDISAPVIVGEYLLDKPATVLSRLARSESIWERRIAIMATFANIYNGDPQPTLQIAKVLLKDKEDLIHKAVGWMLREVGKRISQDIEEDFLKQHYKTMPRTMLRYSIERFPPSLRRLYLAGKI